LGAIGIAANSLDILSNKKLSLTFYDGEERELLHREHFLLFFH
jgi:hypothetical protein